MSAATLDVDRLRKCAAIMRRGATAGERAAGEAAVGRVAAAAGMSLGDALRHINGAGREREAHRSAPKKDPPRARAKAGKAQPTTMAELLAERARQDVQRRARATREEKRLRGVYDAQEAAHAAVREEQARRDREWAMARGRHPSS